MNILAVETSGFEGSVALLRSDNDVTEKPLSTAGRRHAQTLVSEVRTLLQAADVVPSQVDVVAVSVGPGSFTGLRVGVVFAKTFAWANQATLVAVDTLRVVAQQAENDARPVTVISDAQRNEVFLNRYSVDDQTGCRTAEAETIIRPVAEVASGLDDSTLVSGPGLTKFAAEFPSNRLVDQSLWLPQARYVAQIGCVMFEQGQTADVNDLEPAYIRRSYAEEKASPGKRS